MSDEEKKDTKTITVSGVTFSADQVKSATVEIDGREVYIGEQKKDEPEMGYKTND